jgi:hypothetical protein
MLSDRTSVLCRGVAQVGSHNPGAARISAEAAILIRARLSLIPVERWMGFWRPGEVPDSVYRLLPMNEA